MHCCDRELHGAIFKWGVEAIAAGHKSNDTWSITSAKLESSLAPDLGHQFADSDAEEVKHPTPAPLQDEEPPADDPQARVFSSLEEAFGLIWISFFFALIVSDHVWVWFLGCELAFGF